MYSESVTGLNFMQCVLIPLKRQELSPGKEIDPEVRRTMSSPLPAVSGLRKKGGSSDYERRRTRAEQGLP